MTQRVPDHGEQHPEEWRKDLNPEANKGRNWDEAGNDPEQNAPTAADFKFLRQQLQDFSEQELREINVLTEGTRLKQGATYIDLYDPQRAEFTADATMEVRPGHLVIPKSSTPYWLWNRLIGVQNPERLNRGDEA